MISTYEKISIQARIRLHVALPPKSGKNMWVEHDYKRGGSLSYLAAWDVRRARVFGRFEAKSGIAVFDRLVDEVMNQEPYSSAKRVFWIR